MNSTSKLQEPVASPEKVPYGHVESIPTGTASPPSAGVAPDIDLLRDGVTHARSALDDLGDSDGPIFPPLHVTTGSGEEQFAPGHERPLEDAVDAEPPTLRFGDTIRAYPIAAVLLAGLMGALMIRALSRLPTDR
ncbi:hypothetical protein SNE35_24050 [Paucibacter sp. R3-3]|uniref:Uncharacterized protein n=1 Tax=Roseateles agri TaxID=3098619 RepID=A0ABU5DRD4_9BURK|nr:hypothetical protein [Paucibacter sp. R3-3]MDY0747597.1 hypothetical protein [Paucibacter sp. R3-3]